MLVKSGFFALLAGMGCCVTGTAQSASAPEQLLVSNAKYESLKDKVRLLSQSGGFSLIQVLMDDELMQALHDRTNGKFLNLAAWSKQASSPHLLTALTQKKAIPPTKPMILRHEKDVLALYDLLEPDRIWQNMQHLTSFLNRSAKTDEGVAAARWYKQQFESMANEYGRTDVSSYYIQTGTRYKQPSVVTVIGKGKPGEAIVIGAHIDTLSGNMPGADDDASGIAVALEVSRVLLSAKARLDHPVYIIAYAAEEQGLVGSAYVVDSFLDHRTRVKGVMQFDQAGFRANPKDKTVWLIDDYVDTQLTQFTADLLTHYVGVPVAYTHCGYACSDHANWTFAGYRATYPSATTLDNDNPYVHSSEDKLDIVNLEHMVHFAKLGLAFATELGLEP